MLLTLWRFEIKHPVLLWVSRSLIWCMGAFNNYVDRILPFFDTHPLWTIFIPWAWIKTDIFWPHPPSSCPRSYWMAPIADMKYYIKFFLHSYKGQFSWVYVLTLKMLHFVWSIYFSKKFSCFHILFCSNKLSIFVWFYENDQNTKEHLSTVS